MQSKFLALGRNDLIKGVVMAVLGAAAQVILNLGSSGDPFSAVFWIAVLKTSLSAGSLYLIKNLLTAENGKIFGKIG